MDAEFLEKRGHEEEKFVLGQLLAEAEAFSPRKRHQSVVLHDLSGVRGEEPFRAEIGGVTPDFGGVMDIVQVRGEKGVLENESIKIRCHKISKKNFTHFRN